MEIDIASFGRAALYLGVPFVLLVFYMQWRWARTCDNNIRVLVAQQGGGGAWQLAPKAGGTISIKNPNDDTVRTWMVNELATIDILYPGVGFVPSFLQKTIRMAIVNEGDWEPMLNRSPHREKIASPDVVAFLQELSKKSDATTSAEINKIVKGLATGPTREMIADPAALGNLMQSSVLKALATVSNDLIDILKSVNQRLGKVAGVNPTIVYIGLGLIVILAGVLLYIVIPLADEVNLIKQALGVKGA